MQTAKMKQRRLKLFFFSLTSLLLISIANAGEVNNSFFVGKANNLSQAKICAIEEKKKGLLIFYGTPHCPYCLRMKKKVLNQPEIQTFYKANFHTLEMNILDEQPILNFSGNQTTPKEFAQSNHIRITPTLIFYDLEGERLFKQIGIIADPQEFKWLGEYILEAGYSHKSFSQYKREKRTRH